MRGGGGLLTGGHLDGRLRGGRPGHRGAHGGGRAHPCRIGRHALTATLMLRLAEEGQLSLEDPIADYIEGIPNGEQFTLRQLADMTSDVAGYTRSTQFTDRFFAVPQQVFTPEELVAVGVSESALFAPGARFDYSDTNYILLGLVVEQVTGQPVGEVLEEQIFDPLGLDETVWPGVSTEMPEPYAQGFSLQGDTATPEAPANATHWNPSWGATAGALISDVADLLAYGRAMGTGHTDLRRGLHRRGPHLHLQPRTLTTAHHDLLGCGS
nr:serine hydrolase domain-containing protein [uncultured Kocuria sp.]